MSKRKSELNVVFGDASDGVLVIKVWMEAAGDLYIHRGGPKLMGGKGSYHASGMTHSDVNLIKMRTGLGQPRRPPLANVAEYERISAWGSPHPEPPDGYVAHGDTKIRRTLLIPAPPLGWFVSVWAIAPGRRDLVDRICETNPWPTVIPAGSVLADWGIPWILVTVAQWTNGAPYQVVRYAPSLPGRVPFHISPECYEGTWLEPPGPKWKPGEPFPKEWIMESRRWVTRQARNAERGIPHSRPFPEA